MALSAPRGHPGRGKAEFHHALWGGAKLPNEVRGRVGVVTYTGEESESDAARVVAAVPVLVMVDNR